MEDLKDLNILVNELNETNSSNLKKEILAKHESCKKILKWTYNPFKVYNISSANLKKNNHLTKSGYSDIYELLEDLDSRSITGHEAIACTNGFINDNEKYRDLIYNILDRNLKTRTDAKLINKVWPDLVPSFSVALAQKYKDYAEKIDFEKDAYYSSVKLDGCISGDSLVELETGEVLTIREIVKKKIDKKIKSYNEKTKKIEYKRITAWIKNGKDINEKKYSWFVISLSNGIRLKLTGNHRVYLPELRCYRRVDELVGDEVLLLDI